MTNYNNVLDTMNKKTNIVPAIASDKSIFFSKQIKHTYRAFNSHHVLRAPSPKNLKEIMELDLIRDYLICAWRTLK